MNSRLGALASIIKDVQFPQLRIFALRRKLHLFSNFCASHKYVVLGFKFFFKSCVHINLHYRGAYDLICLS